MKNMIVLRLILVAAVLMTTSMASAVITVWTRPTTSGPGNYSDAANWSAGAPDITTSGIQMGVNAANLAEVQVTDAQYYGSYTDRFRMGYGAGPIVLRIKNGGSLTSADPASQFYVGQSHDAHLIIEAGGTLTHKNNIYAGISGCTGTIDIAGTLDTSQGLGKWDLKEAGTAVVNIHDGGLLKLRTFASWAFSVDDDATIDIQGSGKIVTSGEQMAYAQILIDTGRFAGNGVVGEVIAVYDAGADETSIIASPTPGARDLLPEDGDDDVPVAYPLTLSWTIPSAYDGNDVYVKVWLGTDPNALTAEPNVPADYMSPVTLSPASGLNVTSADIDASVEDTYYWRVDLDVQADPNFVVIGKVQSFTTVSDFPPTVSIETPDTMTWSDEPVALAATITDDAVSTLTYGWTADPDGASDPDLNIVFSPSAGAEDPTVTITNTTGSMVPVTLTLTATDSAGSAEASITIEVYNDACDLTRNGLSEVKATDFNNDCITDMKDFAVLAVEWLNDYLLETEPVPVP